MQEGPTVPVIYVTASLDAVTRRRMREVPGAGGISKPFSDAELFDMVASVLGPHPK